MADLQFLWKNRAMFRLGSKEFYRAWGKRIFSLPELLRRNRRRLKLVNKGAIIDDTAEIGNVIIEGDGKKLSVGPLSIIGRVYMALHDCIEIGERVCITDGVRILTASHDASDPKFRHIKRKIIIEDYVWIGMEAIILPGVKLSRGCMVGAGAVVSKSVPPNAIVVGNPARQLSKTRCEELDYDPSEFLAANRAWLIG